MADENTIVVSIELDDGSVRQGFIRVQNQANSTFSEIAKTAAGVFAGNLFTKAFDTIKNGAKELFGEAVNSARQAERNLQGLNVALAISGRYTQEASLQFQELAEKIQNTTAVSDDTVLSLEKLAITYTKTNAQALKLTETSVNLAAVTGQDVDGALQQLAGTLSGSAGRLQKLFPELQRFTEGQLKAGAAIDFFNSRFAGAAAAQVNTFDGRVRQLGNAFDDFLKSVGKMVTSSPTIVALIKFLGQQFTALAGYFKQFQGQDVFKGPIQSALNFTRAMVQYVGPVVETVFMGINTLAYGIETAIRGVIAAFAKAVAFVTASNPFTKGSELDKSVQKFADDATLNFVNVAEQTSNALNSIGSDFSATTALDGFIEKMEQTINLAQPLKDAMDGIKNKQAEVGLSSLTLAQAFEYTFGKVAHDEIVNFANEAEKSLVKIGTQAIQTLAGGVAQGMAAVGKALVKGQDIFKAFAGAMLSALGQAAIQMGSTYILLGLARLFASYGSDQTGYQLIGVGSAMAVAGGALMAVGEGVSGGGSTAGGAADSGSTSTAGGFQSDQTANPAESVKQDQGPNVTVNVHGNVLDAKESGLRLVEIINDAFNNQGARIQTT